MEFCGSAIAVVCIRLIALELGSKGSREGFLIFDNNWERLEIPLQSLDSDIAIVDLFFLILDLALEFVDEL